MAMKSPPVYISVGFISLARCLAIKCSYCAKFDDSQKGLGFPQAFLFLRKLPIAQDFHPGRSSGLGLPAPYAREKHDGVIRAYGPELGQRPLSIKRPGLEILGDPYYSAIPDFVTDAGLPFPSIGPIAEGFPTPSNNIPARIKFIIFALQTLVVPASTKSPPYYLI